MRINSEEQLKSAVKRLDANDPTLDDIIVDLTFDSNESEHRLSSIVAHISDHLKHLHTIRVSNYFGGSWSDDFRERLKGEIVLLISKNIPCLQRIFMYNCYLSGCGAIAKSLSTNPHIKLFDFGFRCEIGNEGSEMLAEVLKNPQCALEKLCLCGSGIGDSGCAAIMDALPFNSSLIHLDLSSNKIGVGGCQAIAQALQNKAIILEQIILSSNYSIGDRGCLHIADGLKDNTSLKKLFMTGLGISCGWAAMEQTLREKNYTLCHLSVDNHSRHKDALESLVRVNRERPVEAEATKTGIFPHRRLNFSPIQQQEEEFSSSSIEIEMLVKIVSYNHLSALFSFLQGQPSALETPIPEISNE